MVNREGYQDSFSLKLREPLWLLMSPGHFRGQSPANAVVNRCSGAQTTQIQEAPHHGLRTERLASSFLFMLTRKTENPEQGGEKKPIFENKNSALLIPRQQNQKSPLLLFPLKSPCVLMMLAQSENSYAWVLPMRSLTLQLWGGAPALSCQHGNFG